MYRLSQLLDWVDSKLNAYNTPPKPNDPVSSSSSTTPSSSSTLGLQRSSPPANLGTASSMQLTIRTTPLVLNEKKRGAQATTSASSSPASTACALNAITAPRRALHIVFISALGDDQGRRWNEDCVLAERVIAKVVRDWTPEGQVEVVEASVLKEGWRKQVAGKEKHPFRDSEEFGAVKLPLIIEWANGRAAERLRAPANADPDKVRAFFERTSARAAADQEPSTAPGADVRLEAQLPPLVLEASDANADDAAPSAGDAVCLAEVRGAEVED